MHVARRQSVGRRSPFIRVLPALMLVLTCGLAGRPDQASGAGASVAASQAVVALQRLDQEFFDPRAGLYKVVGGQYEPYAALWPTSQVLAAAIGVAKLTHAQADLARVRRIISSLRIYATSEGAYHARVIRSLRYYDDDNWIALDLLDAYALLHDSAYLNSAERVFAFLITGWDAQRGGGIVWADGHSERPTVSTAPASTVAVRLFAISHQMWYLAWAQRLYMWENANLRAPNGLYYDDITADGRVNHDIVSYNQGVMIDANLALAQATHDIAYLNEARHIAAVAAIALPAPRHNRGTYAAFDAMYFQALAHLDAVSPGAASLGAAEDYVRWAWPIARAPRGLIDRTENDLLDQAAFVLSATAVAAL